MALNKFKLADENKDIFGLIEVGKARGVNGPKLT